MKKLFCNTALLVVSVLFFLYTASNAQLNLDNWKTYTSLLDVQSASFDSRGRIWAGSSGGVFLYDPLTASFTTFNNLNGLLSSNITKIKCNNDRKKVFICGFDGNLDIVTEDLTWTHITDIKNSRFPEPQINDIIFDNDIAYVAGGFGISVLDLTKNVFLRTPPRLGNFAPNTGVNQILKSGNFLWAATKSGIARVDLNNSIVNPDNWKNYTTSDGLNDNNVGYITENKNQIYAATKNQIYLFDNDSFKVIINIPTYTSVKGLSEYKGNLCFASNFLIQKSNYDVIYDFGQIKDSSQISGFVAEGSGKLVIFLKNGGVYYVNGSDSLLLKPNCPAGSSFSGLTVDRYGTLWAASGTETQVKGFMKFENEVWENLNNTIDTIIGLNYFRASSNKNGDVVISSWGFGYINIKKVENNYLFERVDHSNSPLVGLNNNQSFVVTGQSASDNRNGITWVVNYAPNSQGPLIVGRDQKGSFYSFDNQQSVYNRDFLTLIIDDNGTKWLGSSESGGLYYFNEMNTFDKTSDDKWGTFNTSNSNLPNATVSALAVDKTGIIWVGTPTGLAVILNPGAILRNANPFIRKVTILAQLAINDIMVDALNYKWIATNEGVWVINADGTEVIGYLSQKNSPLLSDEVISLATDQHNGRIFFGTKVGLNVVSSLSIEPLTDFKIDVYPQPFNPDKDKMLIIEGLAQDAEFAIVTIDGELVKKIKTSGRKAIWDGINELGNVTSAGVYLIVASSATKDATTTVGKFAIVR